jgi:pseudaminic acid synthase
MVDSVRDLEKALGKVTYKLTEKVEKNKQFARSLFVVNDSESGDLITKENIRSIRPGNGLHPKYYKKILGKKFSEDVTRGEPLTLKMIK